MAERDPHESTEPPHTYECVDSGERVEADSRPVECPARGRMQNISKPREK